MCWIPRLAFVFLLCGDQAFAQDTRFQRWDANNDGRLVRGELPEQLRKNFDRVDADSDGFITAKEHDRFVQRGRNQKSVQRDGSRLPAGAARLPAGVKLLADLPYADTENPRQTLDLMLPVKHTGEKPLPVVVFIHGGGWRKGDKLSGRGRVAKFATSGDYAAASIGYRLSGEAQWPAQIYDCKAAIRWLKGNADKYGMDPNAIGVYGTSAGGHLVAMLGVSGDVKALEGELGAHSDQDSRVTCVVDFFGPAELLTMNDHPSKIDHDAADSPEGLLLGGAAPDHPERAKNASPMTYVSEDDAPILIMHGTKDPLVPHDQSVRFQKALSKSGVDATLVSITGGGHGFAGAEIDRRIRAFIDKHLRGKDAIISDEPIPAR